MSENNTENKEIITDNTEDTENITKNIENIENAENIENTENAEPVEIVELTDIIEPVEDIEFDEPDEPEEPDDFDELDDVPAGEEKPKGAFKNSIFGTSVIMGFITVITVFAISLLNSVTAPAIEQRLHGEKEAAIIWLFGLGVEFEALEGFEDIYLDYDAPVTEVFLVRDEKKLGPDKTAGYCVTVAPKGFTDDIIILVAVNPNITVKDTLILSMSETAGYGTKIDSEGDGWFREQFKNKTRGINDTRIEPATDENAVQIIIGATVTSRAFLRGVNAALEVAAEIREQIRAAPPAEIIDLDEPEIIEENEEVEKAEEGGE